MLELRPSEILRKFLPEDKADRFDLLMVKETIQRFKVDDGSVLTHATVDLINERDEPAPAPVKSPPPVDTSLEPAKA